MLLHRGSGGAINVVIDGKRPPPATTWKIFYELRLHQSHIFMRLTPIREASLQMGILFAVLGEAESIGDEMYKFANESYVLYECK